MCNQSTVIHLSRSVTIQVVISDDMDIIYAVPAFNVLHNAYKEMGFSSGDEKINEQFTRKQLPHSFVRNYFSMLIHNLYVHRM